MHYLALLEARQNRRPEGALTEASVFARVYNLLLPHRHRFTSAGGLALYDGEPLSENALVALRLFCAEQRVAASLEAVRQAALGLCGANLGRDPWEAAVEARLGDAMARHDEGLLAAISIRGEPHWFVALRGLKLELGAVGAPQTRRLRAAMQRLGWTPRPAHAWGRRQHGFVRRIERPIAPTADMSLSPHC